MGWFEAVDGDRAVKVKGEMFISSFDNTEWSVVRWLEWFLNSIIARVWLMLVRQECESFYW